MMVDGGVGVVASSRVHVGVGECGGFDADVAARHDGRIGVLAGHGRLRVVGQVVVLMRVDWCGAVCRVEEADGRGGRAAGRLATAVTVRFVVRTLLVQSVHAEIQTNTTQVI